MLSRPKTFSLLLVVILIVDADGSVRHWHFTSGQAVGLLKDNPEQTNHVAYRSDGLSFATAGADELIRLYDPLTMKPTLELRNGNNESTAGHSNRVFCVKYRPKDPNVLISAGWDNTIQVWDTRTQNSVQSFYGPHICGDALDFDDAGDRILSGSYANQDTLQVILVDVDLVISNWQVIGQDSLGR